MNTLNGLPVHVLLVHAVVVLMPLSALVLVLTAFWASARRRLAGANALLALSTVVIVPLTTGAGEWLEQHVPNSEQVREHAEVGGTAIFFAIALAVMAVVIWWRDRESDLQTRDAAHAARDLDTRSGTVLTRLPLMQRTWLAPASKTVTRVIAVIAVLVAVATLYDIYRIGDSGAKASWDGKVTSAPYVGG
ncbi:hypothetical protein GCM10009554_08800 [Kribbella koreensis]|uniref:Uncharacterized protein n=1 Tax=Kribbella koreensis TaxID=57909 RepID=A0ABP3ZZ33_9ACTN